MWTSAFLVQSLLIVRCVVNHAVSVGHSMFQMMNGMRIAVGLGAADFVRGLLLGNNQLARLRGGRGVARLRHSLMARRDAPLGPRAFLI